MVSFHSFDLKITRSDPLSPLELKSPFEYTCIAQLMGVSTEKAQDVNSQNILLALSHGGKVISILEVAN